MGLYEDAQAARVARDEQEMAASNAELARKNQEESELLEFCTTFAKAAQDSGYPTMIIGGLQYEHHRKGLFGRVAFYWRYIPLGVGWLKQIKVYDDGYDSFENYIVLTNGRLLHSTDRAAVNWVPDGRAASTLEFADRPEGDYMVLEAPIYSNSIGGFTKRPELPKELTALDFSHCKRELLPWLGDAIAGPSH